MICFAQINMTEVLKASELRVPMPPENMSINRDRSGEHHQNMDGPPQPAHAHFTPPTSVSDLELLQHRVNWGTFSKLPKIYIYIYILLFNFCINYIPVYNIVKHQVKFFNK